MEPWREELYHHGIKGQKWGVRRYQNADGTRTEAGKKRYNENYSGEQRTRDKRVYSSGAVRRINKRMNNGETIQSARSPEANRIENFRKASRVSGQIGSYVGIAAGGLGGSYAVNKLLSKTGATPATQFIATAVGAGAGVAAGKQIGRYMGVSVPMLIGGYNPSKMK